MDLGLVSQTHGFQAQFFKSSVPAPDSSDWIGSVAVDTTSNSNVKGQSCRGIILPL